jgi:sporulation protein YlmC with PRC-barrel domain
LSRDNARVRGGKMEIEYGARVVDKRGKVLGVVDKVLLDKWSGEITKFKVNTGKDEADLLISPEDVLKATPREIELKVDIDEPKPQMGVEYGAEVFDKNERLLGTVDYIVNDAWTGEISGFKVSLKKPKTDLVISTEDVIEATPTKVRLGVTLAELKSA